MYSTLIRLYTHLSLGLVGPPCSTAGLAVGVTPPKRPIPVPAPPICFCVRVTRQIRWVRLSCCLHPPTRVPTHVSDRSLKLQDIDCCSQDSTEQLVVLLRQTYPHYHESIMPRPRGPTRVESRTQPQESM